MNNKGFTLFEILVYTAISTLVAGLAVGSLITFTRIGQKESATSEVSGQMTFVLQRIQQLVSESSNIDITAGVTTSTIKLRMQDAAKDPTCIYLSDGIIKIAEGPDATYAQNCNLSAATDLTNSKVIVNTFDAKKLTQYPGHDTLSLDMTMTYNGTTADSQIQRSLSSAIARVSAATFDADVLPGSSLTYNLGQNTLPWQNVYMKDGTASSPSYTFANNTGTGFSKDTSTSSLVISTAGVERMRITAAGNVGIGTASPGTQLEITTANSASTLYPLSLTNPNNQASSVGTVGLKFSTSAGPGGSGNEANKWSSIESFDTDNWGARSGLSFTTSYDYTKTKSMVIKNNGNVGIGTTTPSYKLDVAGTINASDIYKNGAPLSTSQWTTNGSNIYYNSGNVGIGTTAPTNTLDVRYTGTINTYVPVINVGNASNNMGGSIGERNISADVRQGLKIYSPVNLSLHGVGLSATSPSIQFQTGVLGAENSSVNTVMTILQNGNVGIGTASPGYTLTVSGTAWVSSGAWSGSDIRWKKDIVPLSNVLGKVNQLQGVKFDWRKDEFPQMNFPSGSQIGFIAQQVEPIFPELVTTDNNGYKGISYEKFVPVLVEATKEQQAEIEQLKTENENLKSRLDNLETKIK